MLKVGIFPLKVGNAQPEISFWYTKDVNFRKEFRMRAFLVLLGFLFIASPIVATAAKTTKKTSGLTYHIRNSSKGTFEYYMKDANGNWWERNMQSGSETIEVENKELLSWNPSSTNGKVPFRQAQIDRFSPNEMRILAVKMASYYGKEVEDLEEETKKYKKKVDKFAQGVGINDGQDEIDKVFARASTLKKDDPLLRIEKVNQAKTESGQVVQLVAKVRETKAHLNQHVADQQAWQTTLAENERKARELKLKQEERDRREKELTNFNKELSSSPGLMRNMADIKNRLDTTEDMLVAIEQKYDKTIMAAYLAQKFKHIESRFCDAKNMCESDGKVKPGTFLSTRHKREMRRGLKGSKGAK